MKRIINKLKEMSGHYHAEDIFRDWVEMTAISISNAQIFNRHLEDKYLGIVKKYNSDELKQLSELTAILTELFEENIYDYLGSIYMGLGSGSSKTGQFFTPFHLCETMAKTTLVGYDGSEVLLNEPSSGGGGNILAYAKALKEKGYNYQEKIKVVAQDLDYQCVFMSYVQLSLCGLNAKVIQGNTLADEKNLVLYTPLYVLKGGRF